MKDEGLSDAVLRSRFCDVVMKGGITSGVVYPKAVVALARHFQLKNIGGTSAGAIAAAAAAAAEFARRTGSKTGGYDLLAGLPNLLGRSNSSNNTNLFTFFQPQAKTAALFHTLVGALEANSKAAVFLKLMGRATIHFAGWLLAGVLPGIALATLEWLHGCWFLSILWLGLGFAAGLIAVTIGFARSFGSNVGGSDGNYFGLCTGMSNDSEKDKVAGPSKDGQALTVWLSKYLNELAGLDPDGPPLTFGQLWDPKAAAGEKPEGAEKEISLEMFTTCLTKGRPFRLPFRNDDSVRENVLYFRKDELAKFFPANVVQWMKDHPRQSSGKRPPLPDPYSRMPDPWNLPVVVATRMSLSFPILLSAVRLWTRKGDLDIKDPGSDSQESSGAEDESQSASPVACWFSDGGICSNFPIHLFDAPLPGWPTFGITLVDKPEGTSAAEIAQPKMVSSNSDGIEGPSTLIAETGSLAGIAGFVSTIISTMQNWQDNTLSRMPGYRDRIAEVGLTPDEGGLNLKMPEPRIAALSKRGDAAAQEFIRRFTDLEPKMNWSNHRWIRFRSLMGTLEEMLLRIDQTCGNPQPGDKGYSDWVENLQVGDEPSYPWKQRVSKAQAEAKRQMAIGALQQLRAMAEVLRASGSSLIDGSPRPRPELKPRPRT